MLSLLLDSLFYFANQTQSIFIPFALLRSSITTHCPLSIVFALNTKVLNSCVCVLSVGQKVPTSITVTLHGGMPTQMSVTQSGDKVMPTNDGKP